MNRRDLLQFFGIGTLITPVVGGEPLVQAAAKLLSVPDLADTPAFPNGHFPDLFSDRLKWSPYEAIWLAMWQIENNPSRGTNYGIGPLEHVLGREPTEAEKSAVAALIQWFGTNCGRGFIESVMNACGFGVEYGFLDKTSGRAGRAEHAKLVRDLHIYEYQARPIHIDHMGRTITLEYGKPFSIK